MAIRLKPIKDQVIVITGASSGIGLATALEAGRRGARVVLASRDEQDIKQAADQITSEGGQALPVIADVGDQMAMEALAEQAIVEFDRIDTWVNNAGVSIYGRVLDQSLDDHRRLFETNYWGMVHGSMVACNYLRERGGALINVGSVLSDRAIPVQGTYSASKHAMKGYTDALRMELEKEGIPISVTLVKPSAIDTPYIKHARNLFSNEPLNPPPVYSPESVAEAILHCAQHPEREIIVGGGGRFLSEFAHHAPRLTDKLMQATMFDLQRSGKSKAADHRDSLHFPTDGGQERGGYSGHVAESSVYTRAALHPWLVGLLIAGTGLAVINLWKSRSRDGEPEDD